MDALEIHIAERRMDDGMDEDEAYDFEKHPATDDELRDAEIWFLTKDMED